MSLYFSGVQLCRRQSTMRINLHANYYLDFDGLGERRTILIVSWNRRSFVIVQLRYGIIYVSFVKLFVT